jgi:hypothetical protein
MEEIIDTHLVKKYLYHGSPTKHNVLYPQKIGSGRIKEGVFLTPLAGIASIFTISRQDVFLNPIRVLILITKNGINPRPN